MFARSFQLGRLAGIAVRLDASLLLFAVLVAWVFGANFLQRHGLAVAAVMAVTATLLFLGSVLVHELAHGLEARYRDIPVHGITLFFFGGMTEMQTGSRSPRDEFAVSAVGPYASLVCGAAFGLVAAFAPMLGDALAGPVAGVAGLLAWLNLFLAAFNLVPGAPLDGGRVLRAALWWLLGDRNRAVLVAGRAGQVLAATLVLLGTGLLAVGLGLGPYPDGQAPTAGWVRLAESPVFGIVLVLVGAFIFQAARTELAQNQVDRLLEVGRVRELLGRPATVVEADRPLDLVDPGPDEQLLPVILGGQLVGLLPAERIRALHPADRTARTGRDLMDAVAAVPELSPDASLRELVDRLLDHHGDAVLVRDEGGPVAVLSERQVARGLERLRRVRNSRREPAADQPGVPT
jgi:Zn-dependent protease